MKQIVKKAVMLLCLASASALASQFINRQTAMTQNATLLTSKCGDCTCDPGQCCNLNGDGSCACTSC